MFRGVSSIHTGGEGFSVKRIYLHFVLLLQVASISQLTVSRLSRQCGILNILQPRRPPWNDTWIALLKDIGLRDV
jgi:hypothetical protein